LRALYRPGFGSLTGKNEIAIASEPLLRDVELRVR